MSWQDKESYLKEVLSQVKFSFDHEFIEKELRSHLEERLEDYISEGYTPNEAEKMALENFGDPKEIGIALNKEHNPVIGWLLYVSNGLLFVACLYLVFNLVIPLGMSLFGRDPSKTIPKDDILYSIEVNEKRKIDDRIITVEEIIYEKNGNLHIIYSDVDTRLWGGGWSFGNLGIITDDTGKDYFDGSGFSTGGIFSKSLWTIHDFPEESKMLNIEYDYYNRYYKFEIPLQAGGAHE